MTTPEREKLLKQARRAEAMAEASEKAIVKENWLKLAEGYRQRAADRHCDLLEDQDYPA